MLRATQKANGRRASVWSARVFSAAFQQYNDSGAHGVTRPTNVPIPTANWYYLDGHYKTSVGKAISAKAHIFLPVVV